MAFEEPINQVLATRTPLMMGVPGSVFVLLSGLASLLFMARLFYFVVLVFVVYVICVLFTLKDPTYLTGKLDQWSRALRGTKKLLP